MCSLGVAHGQEIAVGWGRGGAPEGAGGGGDQGGSLNFGRGQFLGGQPESEMGNPGGRSKPPCREGSRWETVGLEE